MHVSFVSLCQGRALSRTRQVLDRYATRVSDRAWQSPMTTEALDEILGALRKKATRQTAVACYGNDGRNRMRLLWTVGKKHCFGESGEVAIATRARKPAPPPPWAKTASLIARTAGLGHDIGKATARFNAKLRATVKPKDGLSGQGDRIRHEWMSVKVLDQWRKDMSRWELDMEKDISGTAPRIHKSFGEGAWLYAMPETLMPAGNGLVKRLTPLGSAKQAVDLAILTHHGIFGPSERDGGFCPDASKHIRQSPPIKEQPDQHFLGTFENIDFQQKTERKLWSLCRRVNAVGDAHQGDTDYWRGITLMARAALIASDHYVSAKVLTSRPRDIKKNCLYANTHRTPEGRRLLNQPLDWHLTEVGLCAGNMALHLARLQELPGISEISGEQIELNAQGERFQWQNTAAGYLEKDAETAKGPRLVLNLASTGSGKTRGNMRIAAAMRCDDAPLRISLALNLRSLTLQTHDALRDQIGISESDMSCLIGDTFTLKAHQASGDNEDNDETPEGDIEVYSRVNPDAPSWLMDWMTHPATNVRDSKTLSMISAPILISTVDYLVQAGVPGSQGHHVKALARVASSDLILDEIDNYSPTSLVAVLRIVMMAALFGRNVIASSATLSSPVANALVRAFYAGHKMYCALNNVPHDERCARISLVDDVLEPQSSAFEDIKYFGGWYSQRIGEMMERVRSGPVRRLAFIQDIPGSDADDAGQRFKDAILESVRALHDNHKWAHPSGKKVSFGVVRVANVRPCVDVAHFLNACEGVCATAYHAKELKIRRHLKERRLDALFTRKDPKTCPLSSDPEIDRIARESDADEVCFVVVATPVEEVGRDHDFDWAVIEPSSAASIVQMAGRVNRHRLEAVSTPNVAILDRNLRSLKGELLCFHRPGNQINSDSYGCTDPQTHASKHSMSELLAGASGWCDLGLVVNADLHFGDPRDVGGSSERCQFAKYDDDSVRDQLQAGLGAIEAEKHPHTYGWLTQSHYEKYILRDRKKKARLRLIKQAHGSWEFEQFVHGGYQGPTWQSASEVSIDEKSADAAGGWLYFSLEESLEKSCKLDDSGTGMEMEIDYDVQGKGEAYFDVLMGGIHERPG